MHFLLYAHNVPVRGRDRSAIYDLHNAQITFIPNVLFDIVAALQQRPYAAVEADYGYDAASFGKYLAFLQQKGLGFFTERPEAFPRLNLDYHCPDPLTSAVVEYEFGYYDFAALVQQLDTLRCRHLELRLRRATPARLQTLAAALSGTTLRAVTIWLEYTPQVSAADLRALYAAQPKISRLLCHSAPWSGADAELPRLTYTQWQLDEAAATLPKPRYVVNSQFFVEARHRNPYYNGKVCVSRRGDIKNCLRHARSFGRLPEATLPDVIRRADFLELWFAAPDAIEELRDSPLRYCTWFPHALQRTAEGYAVAS
ncbi:hypothetical protein EJV47_23995 [Hymenobacter gummosus]|uniref:Uncharacterized protein n=1 Tax=Hymenobacter gummosus TaxID=1776032 RepID=A0A431TWN3_9BACT|nr:hypothetical protein [Hymenobacter gummosus]RTQ45894.1 hypothetical protein EJV47_23995 [Hymenobacter gummosus]